MRLSVVASLAIAIHLPVGMAAGQVTVYAELINPAPDRTLAPGETISVALSIGSDSPVGVSAVELELACEGEEFRIASVTFDPMFSIALGGVEGSLPGRTFRAARAQPFVTRDINLGANGAIAHLATVRLEIVHSQPFLSSLLIKATAVTVGRYRTRTMLQLQTDEPREAAAKIVIRNGEPELPAIPEVPLESPRTPVEPWTSEQTSIDFEVRPVGGGQPIGELAANMAYELHYRGTSCPVAGFALFAVSTDFSQSITAAIPPTTGDWSAADAFQFLDLTDGSGPLPVPGDETHTLRRFALVLNDLSDPSTGAIGHLCNFTTGSAGQLALHLALWSFDPAQYRAVQMITQRTFVVGSASAP